MALSAWRDSPLTQKLAAILSCGILLGLLPIYGAIHGWKGDTKDFHLFYQAALALSQGQDMYVATDGHYIYPPLLAFLLQPLAVLPVQLAAVLWSGLSGIFLFGAILIVAKEAVAGWAPSSLDNTSLVWMSVAIATVSTVEKFLGMFGLGQTDALMLLCFASVLRWTDSKPLLAGLAVGLSANVKYLSLIFLPYFLLKRNYRAACAAICWFLFFLLLPGFQIGFVRLGASLAAAFSGLAGMMNLGVDGLLAKISDVAWLRSVSLTSACVRLSRSLALPDLIGYLAAAVLLAALLGAAFMLCRREGVRLFRRSGDESRVEARTQASVEWALLIVVAFTFSPQSTERHLTALVLVYTIAGALIFTQEGRARFCLIATLMVAVAGLSFPFKSLGVYDVWRGVGGPSWCALPLTLAIVGLGARAIAARRRAC